MHILLAIIGVITAISVWAWRMQALSRAARDSAELAKTAANLPRRIKFQHQAGKGGLKLVGDPREAVAILLLEVARAGGEVTASQKAMMREVMAAEFDIQPNDADDLILHAAWLTRDAPPANVIVSRMSDFLLSAPGIGPKQIVDVDQMLVSVSEADGTPSGEQLAVLQGFRDKVGLLT